MRNVAVGEGRKPVMGLAIRCALVGGLGLVVVLPLLAMIGRL